MCGIFGYLGRRTDAAHLTLTALKTLEYRGYDSWGIAVKSKVENEKGPILVEKHIGKIGEAQTSLGAASFAIGHTRWATHGGVTDANAHPHLSADGQVAVVHNGIVENYAEHKATLTAQGVVFISQTDTEVVAHLISQKMHAGDDFALAVMETFVSLVGSNAIVAMDAQGERIVACRDGSPLVVGVGEDEVILGSDVTALLPYTKNVYFIRDGEAVCLSRTGVTLYDIKTKQEKKLSLEAIEWSAEIAQKGHYPHFTLKEISEQAQTIDRASKLNSEVIASLAPRLTASSRVIFTGCGTAYHCALLAKYLCTSVGVAADAIAANEMEPFVNLIDDRSLIVAVSQSGETADTLIAAKAAKARGAHLVAVVNARSSTLERLADTVLSVGSGPEIGVVSTKAFTAQVTTLAKLIYTLQSAQALHIEDIATWLSDILLQQVQDVAARLINTQDMYVIGKHEYYPVALETALKIKESSYIHAEGFAAGELKHGVISLIQKDTPCIVIAGAGQKVREVLSSAIELKTRGGLIIGVAAHQAAEYDIHIPTLAGDLTGLLTASIVGQLLGYYLAVGRGLDPDKPRNLAKSVTVK